jgi:hypothetical protein
MVRSSSTRDPIRASLRNAGFTVAQIGGGPEYPRDSLSTNTPLRFFEARSS